MTRRGGAVALIAAVVALLTAGCPTAECTTAADCQSKRGNPPSGSRWTCVADVCVPEAEVLVDAGQPDAGPPDAGPVDAGQPDAGLAAKGGACQTSTGCQAGLRCEMGDAGTATCQALHLAFTLVPSGGGSQAAAVRFDEPTSAPLVLGESAKWPRWDRSGKAVVFVADGGTDVLLVRRDVMPTLGAPVVLTDAGVAATQDFSHLEWEPGLVAAWTQTQPGTTGVTGIFAISPDGGQPYQVTENGGFPSFSADGGTIAYNNNATGLRTAPANGTNLVGVLVAGGDGGVEPLYNRANDTLVFRRARTGDITAVQMLGGGTQPLYGLYAIPAAGGTPTPIDEAPAPQGTGGATVSGYWVSYPTVAEDGTLVAYTRTNYTGTTAGGTPVVTLNPSPNDIYVQQLDPATGLPKAGAAPQLIVSNAVQPSLSPDGRYLAYVQGSTLFVQQLAIGGGADAGTPGDAGTPADGGTGGVTKVGTPLQHTGVGQAGTLPTAGDDDNRPRWQPK